jgi:hypothetical protein
MSETLPSLKNYNESGKSPDGRGGLRDGFFWREHKVEIRLSDSFYAGSSCSTCHSSGVICVTIPSCRARLLQISYKQEHQLQKATALLALWAYLTIFLPSIHNYHPTNPSTLLPLHLHFHRTSHPPNTELRPVNNISGP